MKESDLEMYKNELIHKKEKFINKKYQNDKDIRIERDKRKDITNLIRKDYIKHKNTLNFHNYLCSIKIKDAKILSYDSRLN